MPVRARRQDEITSAKGSPGVMSKKKARRKTVEAIAAAVLAAGAAVGVGAGPALAAPARQADPRGELAALYREGLGRGVDASGNTTFGGLVDENCAAGLMTAGYSIGVSPEATGGRLAGPDDVVNYAYIGLLGRVPDVDGWQAHHRSLLNGRSREHVLTSVMASPEYRSRIASICAGTRKAGTNAMTDLAMNDRNDETVNNFARSAAGFGAGCGSIKVTTTAAGKVTIGGLPIGKAAATAAKAVVRAAGGNTLCTYTADLAAAAAHGKALGSQGEAVYWSSTSTMRGCAQHYTFKVGPNPVDVKVFSGTLQHLHVSCIAANRAHQ